MKSSGKRCLDEEDDGKEEDSSSKRKLSHVLECPVCQNICQPPIYNCARGHSLCNVCIKKLKLCGLCKSKMTKSRNFIAEEIVETHKFSCEYAENGCRAKIMGKVYDQHVDCCVYGKSVKCHLNHLDNCNAASLEYKDYLNHLTGHHRLAILRGSSGNFSVLQSLYDHRIRDTPLWKGLCLNYNSLVFLPLSFVSSDILHFAMALLGSDLEATQYRVKIQLKYPVALPGQSLNISATIPVLPLQECTKVSLISKSHQTLTVSKFNLQKSCLVDLTSEGGLSLEWLAYYEIIKVPGK